MAKIVKNERGDDLYILVESTTMSIEPRIYINTKSKVMEKFHLSTKESNDGVYLAQLIHKVSNGTKAKASMRCNRKGWGCDYFVYITVEPLYTND